MPVTERRLNLRFINEHLEKLQEIQKERQTVTADKPLISKPNIKPKGESATYTSTVKKK